MPHLLEERTLRPPSRVVKPRRDLDGGLGRPACRMIGTHDPRVPARVPDPRSLSVPTYQYACTECDQRLEVVQSFSDAALTECPACSGRLRKVFSAVGVVFKGSGFYKTDSRPGAAKGSGDAGSGDKGSGDKGSGDKAGAAASSDGGSSGKASADKGSSAPAAAPSSSSSTPAKKSA
jgi:putative FmdB family regulatory protein